MILLYCLNALVIGNALLITKRIFFRVSIADKILICFTLWMAQIIFIVLLLGISSLLTLANLAALACLLSLLILFILRKKKDHPFFPQRYFINEALLKLSRHKLLALSASITAGFSLVKIFYNLINPPFLWGSLIYHYNFPANWLKNGNLINPPLVFGNPGLQYIAMNAEFLFFWFMAPLRNAFMADLTSCIFYFFAIIACYSIMRKLGASREIALLSGILFSLTPQYFKHLLYNGNDIIVAALVLIALNFTLGLREKFSLKNIVLAGVSAGLMLGAKSTATLWLLALIPLVIIYMIGNYRNLRILKFMLFGLLFIALILAFGGFTYIRNAMETGNPLYPVEYNLFNITLKGPVDYMDYYDNINLRTLNLGEILFHQSLGLHFVVLAFPAFFLSLPMCLIRTRFRFPLDISYILALPLIMIILFYTKSPFHTPSYAYHFVALGTIVGIYALAKIGVSIKVLKGFIFVLILAAVAELTGHKELVYSLVLSGIIFAAIGVVKNKRLWPYYKRFSTLGVMAIFLILIPLESYYEKTKYEKYSSVFHWEKDLTNSWKWIYEKSLDVPKNIAYAGSAPVFPLFGARLKNNVYCVSVNDKEPYLTNFKKYYHLHESFQEWIDLMGQDGCLREKADFETWIKNLRSKDTDLLFIMYTDDFKSLPIEDEWARAHHEIFRPVLANIRARIYEIVD